MNLTTLGRRWIVISANRLLNDARNHLIDSDRIHEMHALYRWRNEFTAKMTAARTTEDVWGIMPASVGELLALI